MSKRAPLAMNEPQRDIVFSVLLILAGAIGMLNIVLGGWHSGPGGGNHLVPLVVYGIIFAVGGTIMCKRLFGKKDGISAEMIKLAPIPVGAGLIWAGAYFLAVRHVGIASSTFVFIATAVWLLSMSRERNPVTILVVAAGTGVVFWMLFTHLAPILLSRPVLI